MKILVTFAVDFEFAPWRRQHDFREVLLYLFLIPVCNVCDKISKADRFRFDVCERERGMMDGR